MAKWLHFSKMTEVESFISTKLHDLIYAEKPL